MHAPAILRRFVGFAALLAVCSPLVARAADPWLEKIDLFVAGDHGYAKYHIPGIVVTARGTVLAWCEARKNGGDWDSIDVLLRRSTDDGRTWSDPLSVAHVEGPKTKNPFALALKSVDPNDVTYNNPVLIADRDGTVHFLFCLEYMRVFYMRSTDDGVSWSKPVEITSTFEAFRSDYDWKVLATGPNHSIQTRHGRLIVPVWLSTGTGGNAHRPSVTATIYSDDGGNTWLAGDIAFPCTDEWINPNETVAIELNDGRVMLNARNESRAHRRLVSVSPDGAHHWSRPKFDDALLEPICMAGIVRYSLSPDSNKNRILFCNPDNLHRDDGKEEPGVRRDRKNLSVKLSYDEGKTWAVNKSVEPGYSAYSDIAVTRQGTILCFYGRGSAANFAGDRLTVARFNLEWLTDGQDTNVPAATSSYGGRREDFEVAGGRGFVIHPTQAAPGGAKPWIWYAPTIGHHPSSANAWLMERLLERGFYVAGINVGESFANPRARQQYDQFYQHVTREYGLDAKVCLLAQSRGGLNMYNFAADHPGRVSCIAGIYTVGDLLSFPKLNRAAAGYGLTPAQFQSQLSQHNPIERLEPIAAARIPILHIHGDADTVVPIEDNSQVIYDRYRALGGPMELIVVPGKGHQNDTAFFESQPMLDFIVRHGLGANR